MVEDIVVSLLLLLSNVFDLLLFAVESIPFEFVTVIETGILRMFL